MGGKNKQILVCELEFETLVRYLYFVPRKKMSLFILLFVVS